MAGDTGHRELLIAGSVTSDDHGATAPDAPETDVIGSEAVVGRRANA
jgi:hypothetical protein